VTKQVASPSARETTNWSAKQKKEKHKMSETKKEEAKPATDADLMRQVEMLKAQVETREKQLRQAIDIANRANDERKARDEAEKGKLLDSIIVDSHFTKDELKDKSLSELQTMRITLDKSIEKTFASVAAEMDEAKRIKQPFLTAGAWDAQNKKWVGGL
jgi:LPS O-antigen subunit length determinant protein (WzzB/FepE family)